MKKIFTILMAFAVGIFFIPGCSKKKGCTDPASSNYDAEAEEDDGSCTYPEPVAGLGGNTTIVAFPKHHNTPIPSQPNYLDSAFVKFNTLNSPGTNVSDYDTFFVGTAGEDHVHLEGLKKGKYYIMMAGFDTTISERVTGGIPYTLTLDSGEVDLDVPVTE